MAEEKDADGCASSGIDVVIPAHEKDHATLAAALASVQRHLPEARRIVIVSKEPFDGAAALRLCEWFPEGEFTSYFCQHVTSSNGAFACDGWVLQQLIKLYCFRVIPGLRDHVLVMDADLIWLRHVTFLHSATTNAPASSQPSSVQGCVFSLAEQDVPHVRSRVDLHRYDDFIERFIPNQPIRKRHPRAETAVVHHCLFQRHVVESLLTTVEAAYAEQGSPQRFFEAFLASSVELGGRVSEYELYVSFARQFFSESIKERPLSLYVVQDWSGALGDPPPGVDSIVSHSHLRYRIGTQTSAQPAISLAVPCPCANDSVCPCRGLSPHELLNREGILGSASGSRGPDGSDVLRQQQMRGWATRQFARRMASINAADRGDSGGMTLYLSNLLAAVEKAT